MARGRAIDRNKLLVLLNAGLPIEDIAAALKCGASGVYEAARRLGYRQRDGKMVRPARDPLPEPETEAPRQDILYEFPDPDASIAEWAKPLSASCESPRGTAQMSGGW